MKGEKKKKACVLPGSAAPAIQVYVFPSSVHVSCSCLRRGCVSPSRVRVSNRGTCSIRGACLRRGCLCVLGVCVPVGGVCPRGGACLPLGVRVSTGGACLPSGVRVSIGGACLHRGCLFPSGVCVSAGVCGRGSAWHSSCGQGVSLCSLGRCCVTCLSCHECLVCSSSPHPLKV